MIDWERVAQLCDEVGPENFSEVVELFLEEVDEAVSRLGEAADAAALAAALHFLKGSALNLGFARFGRLCHEAEEKAARDNSETVSIGPILACYAESRRVFLDAREKRQVA